MLDGVCVVAKRGQESYVGSQLILGRGRATIETNFVYAAWCRCQEVKSWALISQIKLPISSLNFEEKKISRGPDVALASDVIVFSRLKTH